MQRCEAWTVLENDGVGVGVLLGLSDGEGVVVAVDVAGGVVAGLLPSPPEEPLLHAAATNASSETRTTRAFITGTLTRWRTQTNQALAAAAS